MARAWCTVCGSEWEGVGVIPDHCGQPMTALSPSERLASAQKSKIEGFVALQCCICHEQWFIVEALYAELTGKDHREVVCPRGHRQRINELSELSASELIGRVDQYRRDKQQSEQRASILSQDLHIAAERGQHLESELSESRQREGLLALEAQGLQKALFSQPLALPGPAARKRKNIRKGKKK